MVSSFMRLGQTLQRAQTPLTVIDHEKLAACQVNSDGTLTVGGQTYPALLLPHGVELPAAAAEVANRFEQLGGRVVRDGIDRAAASASSLIASLGLLPRIEPASPQLAFGRFVRDGRDVLLLVNVSQQSYAGALRAERAGTWSLLNPANGQVTTVTVDESGHVPLQLEPRECRIYVAQMAN